MKIKKDNCEALEIAPDIMVGDVVEGVRVNKSLVDFGNLRAQGLSATQAYAALGYKVGNGTAAYSKDKKFRTIARVAPHLFKKANKVLEDVMDMKPHTQSDGTVTYPTHTNRLTAAMFIHSHDLKTKTNEAIVNHLDTPERIVDITQFKVSV